MELIRLDHEAVRGLARAKKMRPVDIARQLGVSRQLGHYILHKGGLKHAAALARLFDVRVSELLKSSEGGRKRGVRTNR